MHVMQILWECISGSLKVVVTYKKETILERVPFVLIFLVTWLVILHKAVDNYYFKKGTSSFKNISNTFIVGVDDYFFKCKSLFI